MPAQSILLVLLLVVLVAGLGLLLRRQRSQAERRARNLRALFEVSRQATANLDRQQVLEVVVQSVQDVMGYHMASILLVEDSHQDLVAAAISTNLRDRIPAGSRVPVGQGLVGSAAQQGRTQLANDTARHPRYVRAPGGWDPGSEISVPLKTASAVLGVLDVEDERRGAFGPDDVQVLEALAEQLVVILSKARLLESERRRADRIAILNAIGRQITASLSVDALLNSAVNAIDRDLHYPNVAVMLVDPDQPSQLVTRAVGGYYRGIIHAGEYRQPLTAGVVGRAARLRGRVLVNDVASDPDYLSTGGPQGDSMRAELAVSICTADRLLGVLNIEDTQPFTEDDASGFEIIADQLAIALENARLFDTTQANLAQLSTLYELSQRLSLADDLRALMRASLEVLAVHCQYRCTVAPFDFDGAGRPVRFYVPYFYQPGVGIVEAEQYVAASDDPLNPLLDDGQTVAIADVASDPRVPGFLREQQLAEGRPALALIPLVVGGRRIGNLVLSHSHVHTWLEPELRVFRAAANQIAAALDNARRFQREKERTERLALLARVGQGIAAHLNSNELLATTVEALHGPLGYQHVGLFLLEEAGGERWLVQRAHASQWPPDIALAYRQRADQGLLGAAATRRVPQLVNDVSADPRYLPMPQADIRAELVVPILLGGRLLGVLDVAGTTPFNDDDRTGLVIMADQLAVALENAALYGRAQTVGVLEERQRLARDLHDSVTQLVFSLTLIAQSVGAAYRRDPAEGERRLARIVELSQQSLAEMRALLAELRPAGRVPSGLVPALQKHFERVGPREKLEIALVSATYAPHSPDYEEALYRVVQEALNNVVKHARAARVSVSLAQAEGQVRLCVVDDGQGFDPAGLAERPANKDGGGLGLIGMRERLERLGGSLSLQSSPGAGTTVAVTLPA
jgi:GAF domain-containing protein